MLETFGKAFFYLNFDPQSLVVFLNGIFQGKLQHLLVEVIISQLLVDV